MVSVKDSHRTCESIVRQPLLPSLIENSPVHSHTRGAQQFSWCFSIAPSDGIRRAAFVLGHASTWELLHGAPLPRLYQFKCYCT